MACQDSVLSGLTSDDPATTDHVLRTGDGDRRRRVARSTGRSPALRSVYRRVRRPALSVLDECPCTNALTILLTSSTETYTRRRERFRVGGSGGSVLSSRKCPYCGCKRMDRAARWRRAATWHSPAHSRRRARFPVPGRHRGRRLHLPRLRLPSLPQSQHAGTPRASRSSRASPSAGRGRCLRVGLGVSCSQTEGAYDRASKSAPDRGGGLVSAGCRAIRRAYFFGTRYVRLLVPNADRNQTSPAVCAALLLKIDGRVGQRDHACQCSLAVSGRRPHGSPSELS